MVENRIIFHLCHDISKTYIMIYFQNILSEHTCLQRPDVKVYRGFTLLGQFLRPYMECKNKNQFDKKFCWSYKISQFLQLENIMVSFF